MTGSFPSLSPARVRTLRRQEFHAKGGPGEPYS